MKQIQIALTILAVLVLIIPSPVTAQTNNWVEVNGEQTPLTLASDYNCQWGEGAPALVNLPGMCGRDPATKNRFMIYSHAAYCDKVMCHYGKESGGVYAWPALQVGESVRLFVDGHLYQGRVLEAIHDAGAQGIDGNTEFNCPGRLCGTLTTCADMRPSYFVARLVYTRLR
jgi:hypothetical protein